MPDSLARTAPAPIPIWTRIIVLLGTILFLAGGILPLVNPQMLTGLHDEINNAVRIYAGYVASRDLALAILLFVLLLISAKRALSQLLALVSLIQLIDFIIDITESRWPILPGIAILGVLFLLAAIRLNQNSPWQPKFWKP
jgi:hypothetical protein